jgi:glycosyltransferase involved in cell wall biosynthesis
MDPDESGKVRLLIVAQWYIPGFKAGGPIRSIHNLVELLKEDFKIYVFTSDRDHGDSNTYVNIKANQWITQNGHSIFYADQSCLNIYYFKKVIREINPDTVYLNSMFAYGYFLKPLFALKQIRFKGRIVLAPRGMLRTSALKFKSTKKQLFLLILKLTGLLNGIHFQATNEEEGEEIKNTLNVDSNFVHILENVPYPGGIQRKIEKNQGTVNLIYLGRIHPIKGLDFLLDILNQLGEEVHLEIVGANESKDYYDLCLTKIESLPKNITVNIKYGMQFDNAMECIQRCHFLVSPTHGENFGHAIFEALSSGRPVIISDQTPWQNLQEIGVGWDIPLSEPSEFIKAIQKAVALDQSEFDVFCHRAKAYSEKFILDSNLKEKFIDLFGQK